jgi:Amt family ammonium transporter
MFWEDKTKFRNWFFQGAFCATACTIVSGAMAERTQLKGFATYSVLMTCFIYPIVAYWGWSGSGFLNYKDDDGKSVSSFGPWYKDFAGSGIVHLVGGVGALVGSICVGPRKGRFEVNVQDEKYEFDAHNIPFCVLGTFCLWFGWYGFNPGSTLAMHTQDAAHLAGIVAVNTTLAPCMSGLLVLLLRANVVSPKFLDVSGFCNGILAGLVGITAGCGFVKPWESVIIGLIAGLVYQGASMLLDKLKIDDVVDAFPVHGACGIWGVLAVGLFGDEDEGLGGNGLFYGGDQFRAQLMGVICIVAWVGILSLMIFLPLKKVGMLRWSNEFEKEGADAMEHSPRRPSKMFPDEENANQPSDEKVKAEVPAIVPEASV